MIEMRCGQCNRLLAKTSGKTEVLCPRCGALNTLNPISKEVTYEPTKKSKRLRNTSSGMTFS